MRGLLVISTWNSRVNWMVFARLHQYEVGQVFASNIQSGWPIGLDRDLQQYAVGWEFAAICSRRSICSNMQWDRDLQLYVA